MLTDHEAYDRIHAVLPTFEDREVIRVSRPFKQFLQFWCDGKYNDSRKVGNVMSAANQLPVDATHEDWEILYYKECIGPAKVVEQVEILMQNSGMDFKTALTYWWIHIQDGFFKGEINEKKMFIKVQEYAHSKGYEVRRATAYEDKKLGIDFLVFDPNDNNKPICGVQAKPESHFSNHPAVVRSREVYDKPKYEKFTKEYGAPVAYVIIEPTLATGKLFWKNV